MRDTLYIGDNLETLRGLESETVDLIYLDPPFNSKRIYHGTSRAAKAKFSDVWRWDEEVKKHSLELLVGDWPNLVGHIRNARANHSDGMAGYLLFMTLRLIELHRVLKSTGSLYLHCDPTASHYLKVVLDRIFGAKNFRNEIVWKKYGGHKNTAKLKFTTEHDCIFFYVKSPASPFNPVRRPLGEQTVKAEYRHIDEDGRRYAIPRGRKYREGVVKRVYLDEHEGVAIGNLWTDKGLTMQGKDDERTGWPTQKPLALLRRIIAASSSPGELVLDPFAGCGTATIAAEQLGRRWIGCDIDEESPTMMRVLREKAGLEMMGDYSVSTRPPKRTDLRFMKPRRAFDELYGVQRGNCGGCGKHKPAEDFEVDHIIPKKHNGQDCFENYQLLCSTCNRIKGARPMEYLMAKLERLSDASLRTEF